MRVAWFCPSSATKPTVIACLRAARHPTTLVIDQIDASRAHDFVVEQALRPYDVTVFESDEGADSDFMWAYLFRYPGVFVPARPSLHDSRARTLTTLGRWNDYASEFIFNQGHPARGDARAFARGSWPMLRAPALASRIVAVDDEERRLAIEAAYPGARVRTVPVCSAGPAAEDYRPYEPEPGPVRIAAPATWHRATVARAVARVRSAGFDAEFLDHCPPPLPGAAVDIMVILEPVDEAASLQPATTWMALGRPLIVYEREATARVPAMDPQTWRMRDATAPQDAVVISIDPRDEEHSLVLAIRGLIEAPHRRRALAGAAREWWRTHATPEQGAAGWHAVLHEAARTEPPPLPPDWPAHLRADGLANLAQTERELGIRLDLR